MPSTFTRLLQAPRRSFFLLGPRGTGKTTWLRQRLPGARWYNLLLDRELLRLTRAPEQFRAEVEALPRGAWVVVDEVQRLPSLLNEVHDLISVSPGRVHFALTGSSARKLRRADVNLLAGRALMRRFFPLVSAELGDALEVDSVLTHGLLPAIRAEEDAGQRTELLEAYRDTYLTHEIRAEALVRDFQSFNRFIEVAALMNGQVVNVAGVARDAGVARQTVQKHFDLLTDTLIGAWLPAWRPRARVKETAHPKFYLFDPGVARALAGREREPLEGAERGPLLETWVRHELDAYLEHAGAGGELAYWRTPSRVEVDFVWTKGRRAVGIEVKASARLRPEDAAGLGELAKALSLERALVVYLGERKLRVGDVDVLPLADFFRALWAGKVLGSPAPGAGRPLTRPGVAGAARRGTAAARAARSRPASPATS